MTDENLLTMILTKSSKPTTDKEICLALAKAGRSNLGKLCNTNIFEGFGKTDIRGSFVTREGGQQSDEICDMVNARERGRVPLSQFSNFF